MAASEDTLRAALDRVDAMLTSGELNIASLGDDTMIAGRALERLGQFYEGLPVFGGQVVRQMDGRAIISVTGRLYEALDVDVNPSITPEQARTACRSPPRRRREHQRRDRRSAFCPSRTAIGSPIACWS